MIIDLLTRLVVAVEKLADAQMLIATSDGPVDAARTRAPDAQGSPESAPGGGDAAKEAPAEKSSQERPIGPEEVREALAAVTQAGPDGKKKAREVLASFKSQDGKPVKKVSEIPAGSLAAVHAALLKAVA